MMITGISILGGSYLLSSGIGAALLDEDEDEYQDFDGDGFDDDVYDNNCRDCRDIAPWLFVPVVGPFIAMSQTEDGDGWLWLLGMLQVAGTGLMIGGIIQYKHSKRAADAQGYTHWKLGGNRELALDVSTTPRFAGPRMRLTF
jgi:hypothetical protein